MTTSPPSATAGSILYMPLAATQRSSYMAGMIERTRFTGLSSQTTWRFEERSAAADQASWTGPQKRPATPSCITTGARSESGRSRRLAARSITARTGVVFVPMIS